jgi:hypothetical protein
MLVGMSSLPASELTKWSPNMTTTNAAIQFPESGDDTLFHRAMPTIMKLNNNGIFLGDCHGR